MFSMLLVVSHKRQCRTWSNIQHTLLQGPDGRESQVYSGQQQFNFSGRHACQRLQVLHSLCIHLPLTASHYVWACISSFLFDTSSKSQSQRESGPLRRHCPLTPAVIIISTRRRSRTFDEHFECDSPSLVLVRTIASSPLEELLAHVVPSEPRDIPCRLVV
jgi:hypothetical protein